MTKYTRTYLNITFSQEVNPDFALFSLPRNVTKSAVRNLLPAFGSPGELIISLLLPGGPNYLFKIRFLFCFPSFAKLRARHRGPGYFSSYLLRRRSFCCSSSFFSIAVPVQPDPTALAALQNPNPDPQAPTGQAVQNPDPASFRSTSCWSSARGTGFVPILFIVLVLAVFLLVGRKRFFACFVFLRSTLLVLPHALLLFCSFQFIRFSLHAALLLFVLVISFYRPLGVFPFGSFFFVFSVSLL